MNNTLFENTRDTSPKCRYFSFLYNLSYGQFLQYKVYCLSNQIS